MKAPKQIQMSLKKKEEEVVEQPVQEEEEGDWKAHIKGQMEEAEEKARQEAERKRHEESTPASNKSDDDEHMTEADCRELWRIIQGLEREFREMNEIAEDWFSVHGKKGRLPGRSCCTGADSGCCLLWYFPYFLKYLLFIERKYQRRTK